MNLDTGTNRLILPRLDLPTVLPDVFIVRLTNSATKRAVWCKVADTGNFIDWSEFVFEIVGANADPLNAEVALTSKDKGQLVLTLFGSGAYSEAPSQLDQLQEVLCAF